MALKKTIVAENNFGQTTTLSDCYIRVASVKGSKDKLHVNVEFLSQDKTRSFLTRSYEFDHDMDGENSIKQAYKSMKNHLDFSDAEDC